MNDEPTNEVRLEAPVTETTVEAPKEFDGLSNREALAESMKIHRDGKDPAEAVPSRTEVTQAVQEEVQPPAEFSKEGKEAWKRRDIAAIQKEYRRVHDARTAEISRAQHAVREAREEAQREKESVKHAREMAERVKNYLAVRGEDNLPDEVKIVQALQLVDQLRTRDGNAVKSELLKLGIDLDKASSEQPSQLPREVAEEIKSLQEFKEEYKREKEQQTYNKTVQTFDTIFQNLTAQKTRTGDPVFPGLLDNSESGIEFARELGSLTQDQRFQAGVLRRFPDADLTVVVREAYKYLGGKVAGEPVKVSTTQSNQHLQRSRRASAATPGRSAPRVNDSNLSGKLSNRAALVKALELHREH